MRRLFRWTLFLVMLTLFTIFGGSDLRRWKPLGQDSKTGVSYFYEARGLQRNSKGVYRVWLKVESPSGRATELFEVDCPGKTIRNVTKGTPVEPILLGSTADNLWNALRVLPMN